MHVITVGDVRCDWLKCNAIRMIKVQREQKIKPLYPRVSRGSLVGLRPASHEACREKPLAYRVQPGQIYSKMYGTEPRYNEPRYNEILVIMNTMEKPKRKIFPDITNKCHQATKQMNAKQTNSDENPLTL